jgi:colicin import membrane protein
MLARAKAEREATSRDEEEERHRSDQVRQRTLERLEAERQAELDSISERLRSRERAGETRVGAPAAQPIEQKREPAQSQAEPQVTADGRSTGPGPTISEQRREPLALTGEPGRVAVLLLMQPGSRGIRRFEKTGDPLLCVGTGCYVSTGAKKAATFLPGRKAFGFNNTMGARAGACSKSLVCIYRDVAFDPRSAFVQPVDMRLIRHDRREGQPVVGDSRCKLSSSGALDCRRPVIGPDYRIWIVPEALAREAGPRALERALAEGLPDSQHAALRQ